MITYEAVVIGITITAIVFLINEKDKVKEFFSKLKSSKERKEQLEKVDELIEKEGLSYEAARNKVINDKIMDLIKVSKHEWVVRNDLVIRQGDRVSFVDEEVGLIQGDFLGLIVPEAVGYGDLYVLKKPDNTFRQAPIAYVNTDTIQVYR